ncbi:MAG: DMT family transporter [Alphaproteobacteria bacterium]
MTPANTARLLLLAAIWGASFLMMRILGPVLGALLTAELRVIIAGSALLLWAKITRVDCQWGKYWQHYIFIGAINSALPFALYAWGLLHMPSAYAGILNSSTPLFGAILSAALMIEKLTPVKGAGLVLGACGVALVTNLGGGEHDAYFTLAVFACLVASACYAICSLYIRRFISDAKPVAIGACSQLVASVLLAPALAGMPALSAFTPLIIVNILGLSLLSSGIAYLLYFRLIAEAGPSKAMTVTFLVPMFGMFWGHLLLDEPITATMLAGCALILLGTACVVGLVPLKKQDFLKQ